MTEQTTYPVEATVEQDGRVSVRRSGPVTGSPQAMTSLHNLTRVAPRRRAKSLAERVGESYKHPLQPEEKELLDHAAEQFGQRLDSKE
jgi:hypothetical protein